MLLIRSPNQGAVGVIRCDACRVTTHPVTRAGYPRAIWAMQRLGWDAASVVRHVCPACVAARAGSRPSAA